MILQHHATHCVVLLKVLLFYEVAMSEDEWKERAKGILKAEIARKNLNFIDVSQRLEAIGVHETPQNISNKIGRGTFGAIFMLQVLDVIGCTEIRF